MGAVELLVLPLVCIYLHEVFPVRSRGVGSRVRTLGANPVINVTQLLSWRLTEFTETLLSGAGRNRVFLCFNLQRGLHSLCWDPCGGVSSVQIT